MLNIGVVGIGAIAQKAYLPVMRSIGNVKWYMCTRNVEVLQRESKLLGRCIPCNSVEELLQFDLDGVMIHVSTDVHVEVAKQFLEKGIPVYLDKPIAPSYEETLELYRLAKQNQTFLTVGFNRRFAPKVVELKNVLHKKRIITEKNCTIPSFDNRTRIFDVFIHPLDTALFLMDEKPNRGSFYYKKNRGVIEQCTIYLENEEQSAIVMMNTESGANLERIEIQAETGTFSLQNLTDLTIYQGGEEIKDHFSSWDSTLYKRGFESIVHSFIIAVQTNGENPVSPISSLLSHFICERLAHAKASEGFLSFDVETDE